MKQSQRNVMENIHRYVNRKKKRTNASKRTEVEKGSTETGTAPFPPPSLYFDSSQLSTATNFHARKYIVNPP